MTPKKIQLIRESWERIEPISEQVADIFYSTLFHNDPSVKPLFKDDIKQQGKKLMLMLSQVINLLDQPEKLIPAAQALGQRHVQYGVREEHYDSVGTALLETLEACLDKHFTPALKDAWQTAYNLLSQTMTDVMDEPTQNINDCNNSHEDNAMTQQSTDNDLAVQLQGALDQSGTAIIMINRDLEITYVNQASINLLKKHEQTFQIRWPDFRAEKDLLIGFCIDAFHKKPEHQRTILNDANNLPYVTDIDIEGIKIQLNVTAINDNEGNYIGNSLEWQDVTEARAQENKAVQLQGAIDQSGTAIIMIDRDFEITYANETTFTLLKKHEETFRQRWPSFRADKETLIGFCIDNFHVNPAHQRQLLDDPNNLPWQSDIDIEGIKIQLNVTGIFDAQGNYIGNSLEWQDVTEDRRRALEVGRLSSAMEGMTTNLMMADVEGNILYMNPAVEAMLQRREDQLRTALPSFSVNNLIGSNYDTFHKNPSHQRNLLGNPDNLPYQADISVSGLTFSLTAIALKDEEGNHIGSAVQWVDLTEEKDAQRQVDQLINSAIKGELDQRIDTSTYEGFMKDLGDGVNRLMDNIVEPLNAAISVTQSLSDGDLSQSMNDEYGGEFLALANAMNSSISNLNTIVGEIRSASTNVFSAAREIAQGNDDLSQRTEAQAASLEETSSAMEELTTTVQQNADNASEATKRATNAMGQARNGGEVVQSAVTAMEEITKFSKQIADIIGVIDEIAFQTNLLALNAAVEAARAGEQGRGFAVVAAEVRNLAQRSAGAAKEIKALINDSVEAVGKGTKLVDETGKTFDELVGAVEEVVNMISDIDSASREQSAGINEINSAINQMDEMTQQNAALVEEASASSRSMEEQAQGLLDQVASFKTQDDEDIISPIQHAQSDKQTTSAGTSRRKQKNTASFQDEEWEEF